MERCKPPDGLELLPLAASGGVNYQGPAWYRKQFNLNETMRSKKVILHFEGIMGKSKIWVNGAMIKENFSGYYPIHIDVTEYVDFKNQTQSQFVPIIVMTKPTLQGNHKSN
ncbi:MAG: hypothetical protein CM15mP32_5590 [Flavobacteriaceae bacterium]|nr:MAG: hypothetical protein CM15mP32_5590 [Flavobacteriaceae bacterium]